MEKTVAITGMKCDGCVGIVKENFEKIVGVTAVEVSLEKKTATVTSEKEITKAALQAALTETKFTVS